jgi:hypothetical protein
MEKILYFDGTYGLKEILQEGRGPRWKYREYHILNGVTMKTRKTTKLVRNKDGSNKIKNGRLVWEEITESELTGDTIVVKVNDDGQSVQYCNDIGDFRDIPDEILAYLKV